jgi:hypothetical protein
MFKCLCMPILVVELYKVRTVLGHIYMGITGSIPNFSVNVSRLFLCLLVLVDPLT